MRRHLVISIVISISTLVLFQNCAKTSVPSGIVQDNQSYCAAPGSNPISICTASQNNSTVTAGSTINLTLNFASTQPLPTSDSIEGEIYDATGKPVGLVMGRILAQSGGQQSVQVQTQAPSTPGVYSISVGLLDPLTGANDVMNMGLGVTQTCQDCASLNEYTVGTFTVL